MTKLIESITIDKLHGANLIAARIVAKYGDAYLPVFNRLHKEVQKQKESEEIKNIALTVASGISNTYGVR